MLFCYQAGQILIDHGLHVRLEHLEREGDIGAVDAPQKLLLQPVCHGIVMRFAEEDGG